MAFIQHILILAKNRTDSYFPSSAFSPLASNSLLERTSFKSRI